MDAKLKRDERLWNDYMKLDTLIPADKEDSGPERQDDG
jgi:hypothetical protein